MNALLFKRDANRLSGKDRLLERTTTIMESLPRMNKKKQVI